MDRLQTRYEKSVLIRRIKLAEIGIMLLGVFAFYMESVPLLIGILFLMGTQSTFFGPIKYGILPQHLDNSELTGGNGLVELEDISGDFIGHHCRHPAYCIIA